MEWDTWKHSPKNVISDKKTATTSQPLITCCFHSGQLTFYELSKIPGLLSASQGQDWHLATGQQGAGWSYGWSPTGLSWALLTPSRQNLPESERFQSQGLWEKNLVQLLLVQMETQRPRQKELCPNSHREDPKRHMPFPGPILVLSVFLGPILNKG